MRVGGKSPFERWSVKQYFLERFPQPFLRVYHRSLKGKGLAFFLKEKSKQVGNMKFIPLFIFVLLPFAAAAEPDLLGTVDIQEFDKKKDSYKETRSKVENVFTELLEIASGIKPPKKLSDFDNAMANYVAASYMLCVSKTGSCEQLLDAVLELEVLNSKIQGKAACPNLLLGWKIWVETDMERRVGHRLSIPLAKKFEAFKKEGRPKYLRCQPTVENIIGNSPQDVFFQQRYGKGKEAAKKIQWYRDFLLLVHEKYPNLFRSLGLKG